MAQENIIKKIISSPVIQTLLVYVSGGWIVLEMTDYLVNKYDLNSKIGDVVPIILLIGLPVALILTWIFSRERAGTGEMSGERATEKKPGGIMSLFRKKPWFSIPGILILILLVATGIRYLHRETKVRWARDEALPQIEFLIDDLNRVEAFNLTREAGRYISSDSAFKELAERIISRVTILTDPPGAEVYVKQYPDTTDNWVYAGKTPIERMEFPRNTFLRMKFEIPEYETVHAVASTINDTIYRTLFRKGTIPQGMVWVEGYWDEVKDQFLTGKQGFFMDRFEVTNQQYKAFIDQGGYADPRFWKHEFLLDGVRLSWEEAMARFTDKTGRPGPATWEASDYPEGHDNYPVSGISWYEAAAYAAWTGKSLPTGDHWDSGAGFYDDAFWNIGGSWGSKLIPMSNFNGKGPEPVGKNKGISAFGTYDMAGNVREWCWNNATEGKIISGAAWDDANYIFYYWSRLPPFDRSPENGFRCVRYPDSTSIPVTAFRHIDLTPFRDYSDEEPVSDQVFEIYRNQFLYDSIPLESVVEERDEDPDDWTIERITYNAAYNNERIIALLYLPVNSEPPYQTIIFFPGISAVWESEISEANYTEFLIDFFLKSGRAVLCPAYKGTWERNDGLAVGMSDANMSYEYKDWLIKWVKDFSRSIDYLESRPDIDASRIGYIGWSWGGEVGGIIPAVENRLKATILYVGGFSGKANPEADIINYLPRVTIPVLMLNGKYDPGRSYETNLEPFYNHLGTPAEDKHLLLYETGHFVPKNALIKESLSFLDHYFGPVNR